MAETQSREGRYNRDEPSFSPDATIRAEDFRLDDAAIQADPYAYYPLLRDERPVFQTKVGTQAWWVLSRQEDVAKALMDHQTFSSRTLPDASMLFLDPPEHDRLRAITVPWFSRTVIHKLAEPITKSAEALIGAAAAAGKCDIVADVALKLTVTMISEMLGVPLASVQQLRALRSHGPGFIAYLQARRLETEPSPEAHAANDAFNSVLGGIIDGGYTEGGVVADLVGALQRGEITRAECKSYINILFGAGHSTTTDLIGNAVYVLAGRSGDLDRLAQDESICRQIRGGGAAHAPIIPPYSARHHA